MQPEAIAHLLPVVFQRTLGEEGPNLLAGYLGAMHALHKPSEDILTRLDAYFLALETPDKFLPFLAHWLGLDWLIDEDWLGLDWLAVRNPAPAARDTGRIEPFRLRRLLLCAAALYKERGTRAALIRFLQVATGESNFAVREDARRPFHIVVDYPTTADRRLVKRIVEWQKPAYVTFDLNPTAQGTQGARGGDR